ncbi:CgeB family protein [Brevibacillus ginsengisoli]|uniref:CgeB family protein n=1 Tax=Brevibacillus ginsengisoli TaxID=363854 RepID=UPI003CEDDF1F
MRVLFIDSNYKLQHTLSQGFQELSHNVKISGRLTNENDLAKMIDDYSPDLVVTQGWSRETSRISKEWIRNQVKLRGIPHIYWSVEDPIHTHSFCIPLVQTMQPDYIFTISSQTVDLYRSLGFHADYLDFGYSSGIHYPTNQNKKYKRRIAVVANAQAYTFGMEGNERLKSLKVLVKPLLKRKIRVDFWGEGWKNAERFLGVHIPMGWLHGKIPYKATNHVYNSADIVIGLQNRMDQVSQRTYEILAAGGLMLTLDTPAIQQQFHSGVHLITSASPRQTLNQINYYLTHPKRRLEIRKRAPEAILQHSYRNRAQYIIERLIEHGLLNP